jgi:hypothetical protein
MYRKRYDEMPAWGPVPCCGRWCHAPRTLYGKDGRDVRTAALVADVILGILRLIVHYAVRNRLIGRPYRRRVPPSPES